MNGDQFQDTKCVEACVPAPSECLRYSPDGFGPFPAVRKKALVELVRTRADVFKFALAIVATAVAIVRGAHGPRFKVRDRVRANDRRYIRCLPPLVRKSDIVAYHIRILHNDICSCCVFRPKIVLAVPGCNRL